MNSPSAAISVSELNRRARALLEQGIARLWVEGEVSNLARPASGHIYFSLKDESAQIRCAYFRQRQRGSSSDFDDGDHVLVFGRVSIYEARGDYQLIVEQLEPAGEGELRRRFEALKTSLAAEGLFNDELKQPLPDLPERIGIVTSATGAAIRDILTVLERRFPAVPVVVYPTAVQGEMAAHQIVEALNAAVSRGECEVIILARGGGSLEDLWPFNEEAVARAISRCTIPVVSAIGHEVDFTISDFVADVRAPTPSGAAELVVPDQGEWLRALTATASRLATLGRRYLEDHFQELDWLSRRLSQSSPAAIVARQIDWLANLQQLLTGTIRHDLLRRAQALTILQRRLVHRSPATGVHYSMRRLTELNERLRTSGRATVERQRNRLNLAARALYSVSPLATLERGYAIVSDSTTGEVLIDASAVRSGSAITARLARGSLAATVDDVKPPSDD
ncbi:MAG: exodeoxyribonuclease VII large subunit [Woeseia sp.]